MNVNFDAIRAAAEGYKADMTRFLRDMISHPSESCEEEGVVMLHQGRDGKAGL